MQKLFTIAAGLLLTCHSMKADVQYRDQRRDLYRVLPIHSKSIVFLGNSITNGNEWAEVFGNSPYIVNRGTSGNTSGEIAAHMDAIIGGKPAKVFLLIGINDNADPDIVIPNVTKAIDIARTESPTTELYLQSILPNHSGYASRNPNIERTNELLKTLCRNKGVTFIDIWSSLITSPFNHTLNPVHSNDGLHMMGSGYRTWVKGYEKYIGIKPVYRPGDNINIPSASHGYVNQRLSNFALLPLTKKDILMLGDFYVNAGEWRELLRNRNIKNRGIGVDIYTTSISLTELKEMLPYIIVQRNGRYRTVPAKIFISCGMKDLDMGVPVDTALQTYKEILEQISQLAPESEVFIQSIIPRKNAKDNTTKYQPFNEGIRQLPHTLRQKNIHFIDIYAGFITSDDVIDNVYMENNKNLNGRGYLHWAGILAPYVNHRISPLREDMYDLCILLSEARRKLYDYSINGTHDTMSQLHIQNLQKTIDETANIITDNDATPTTITNQYTLLKNVLNDLK